MNKKIIESMLALNSITSLRAQDVPHTMIQQIAALQGYISTSETGYRQAEEGLSAIRDIKYDEFQLYNCFFGSLLAVNPPIKNMPAINEVVQLQTFLVGQFSEALSRWDQSPWMHADEISYIRQVYKNQVSLAIMNINSVQDLTAEDTYKMTDGEREQLIQRVDELTRRQARAVHEFIGGTDLLIAERYQEHFQSGKIKSLYGLP